MNEVKEMIDAAVQVPNQIFTTYMTWLAEQGFSPEDIREALAALGYGWCEV